MTPKILDWEIGGLIIGEILPLKVHHLQLQVQERDERVENFVMSKAIKPGFGMMFTKSYIKNGIINIPVKFAKRRLRYSDLHANKDVYIWDQGKKTKVGLQADCTHTNDS